MATAPKTPDPDVTKPTADPVAAELVMIRAVHGRMVDPHTALEYSQIPTELFKRTGWIDSQLEAKKMQICDL